MKREAYKMNVQIGEKEAAEENRKKIKKNIYTKIHETTYICSKWQLTAPTAV